jgi:hypothetical protein
MGVPFKWGRDQKNYFQNLKDALKCAPALQLADPANPYIVTWDKSQVLIGAILKHENKNGPHPVGFASRKLSAAERNYPVHKPELLAIVYALK